MLAIPRAGALAFALGVVVVNCANDTDHPKDPVSAVTGGGADAGRPAGNTSSAGSVASAGKGTSGTNAGGAGGNVGNAGGNIGNAGGAGGNVGNAGGAGQSGSGQVGTAGGGGVGAGGGGGQTSMAGRGTTGGSAGSSGCGAAGKPTGNVKVKVADGNGAMRDVELLVPASYDNEVPRAVSIAYHGAGGSIASSRAFGLQDAPGASDAAIFVFPQGIGYKSFGVGWDDTCAGYDMPLFDNMLEYVKSNYCVDTSRVFVSGFSWGCDHVTALACCRGNKIRGVAAASCSDEFQDPQNASTYQNLACPVASGAAIRFTHETLGDAGYPSPMFATTLSLYRAFNHCGDTSTPTSPSPCRSFSGCSHPVVDCPYDGLGHQTPANFGKDTWAFFSSL